MSDGEAEKLLDGTTVGLIVGFLEGARVGIFVDGEALGLNEGEALRILVGQTEGWYEEEGMDVRIFFGLAVVGI